MRRYKAVTRIFLILSVVNFTFAGLTQSQAMHEARVHSVKMAEDMTKVSEKWHKPFNEFSERSAMHAHSRNIGSEASVTGHLADTPLDPEEKKLFNGEWKEETKEDMVFTFAIAAVTGLASQFRDGITGPADPGSCVFSYFLPLLPTL
jgi:hypothetical protein